MDHTKQADEFIVTELVDVGDVSLDDLLRYEASGFDSSLRRILLQVDLPEPLVATQASGSSSCV
ncbi:hypothetical protein LO772_03170 [Yinghuangia sp. ASG 101]|uniref:hypothetical protein n=1 Tax=Yinghuangia sp. ASG 101 TaxID=2896848 RepID=UPI001E4957B7|nr:hypothetical protein [Yinghuangia sp. ASG 101]UGQ12633.1 hypothetical protein LO772_03170 [Yinghuangia sp. ASG 101]